MSTNLKLSVIRSIQLYDNRIQRIPIGTSFTLSCGTRLLSSNVIHRNFSRGIPRESVTFWMKVAIVFPHSSTTIHDPLLFITKASLDIVKKLNSFTDWPTITSFTWNLSVSDWAFLRISWPIPACSCDDMKISIQGLPNSTARPMIASAWAVIGGLKFTWFSYWNEKRIALWAWLGFNGYHNLRSEM